MALLLVLPAALLLQGARVSIGEKKTADSIAARRAQVEQSFEESRDDTSRRRVARHIAVTAKHLETAFKDSGARTLLNRARAARLHQDSALVSYDAKAYERVSVGLGVKFLGRDRLAFRHEDAARVRWSRGNGAWVELTGNRSVVPIAKESDAEGTTTMAPIPYFPGRDNLWIGSGLARAEVDDRELIHPLGVGAEAYYTYESGDSVQMSLPDGSQIVLRELRIAAREPKWNVTVGSFWFDMRSAQMVRAVYRLSTQMDIWAVADEEIAKDRADTTRRAGRGAPPPNGPASTGPANGRGRGGRARVNSDDAPPVWAKAMMSPMKADISGVTIEYGLYNQRFWLPRAQAIEGFAQASFLRVPVTFEQRFTYESVNGTDSVPTIPSSLRNPVTALRDSLRAAGTDSLRVDSLVRAARRARIQELARDREQQCAKTGMQTTYRTQAQGTLRVAMQLPCDSLKLANSPDLPASIYDANDALFSSSERDQLMKSLTYGLQAGWGPQWPHLEYGLPETRYNRIEGLASGIVATSDLGQGFNASVEARGSYADRQLNGEGAAWRSNGRTTLRAAVFRRLEASNDWGSPLSFGASLASLLYARDEGAYYRAWGGELTSTPVGNGGFQWRLFAEQQWGDTVHSRWTLFGGGNDPRFIENPMAAKVTELGGSVRYRPQWGLNPDGFRTVADLRAEAAGGDSAYVRALFDATFTGPLGPISGALTVSGGAATGHLPPQRQFYVGGLQTVRGQTALTASGDAFWLTRVEIGDRNTTARKVIFGDLGWAGHHEDFSKPGRPLAGVGAGMSFLDGLFRVDLARGLWPSRQWRLDVQMDAKF